MKCIELSSDQVKKLKKHKDKVKKTKGSSKKDVLMIDNFDEETARELINETIIVREIADDEFIL